MKSTIECQTQSCILKLTEIPTPLLFFTLFFCCYFWLPWAVEAQFSKPILSHIAADQQVNKNNPAWALKIEWGVGGK